ncbi:folate-binding protein YgfZ [Leptolyngbya sp. FACHB-541]|uniref:CAF17-like 4Fe-4S cluster assembly/insertion protein YgfZ n=1 Tax=Leptolyngbya sp. FACHB-541 TaxID=2692810 RepID=UPI001684285B|nr:folate-binding protein YgfZ [Leptolyngbya sp. FACHB-541]MBD1995645.1 folate-binding protein YgfZ [Leptolyngbya sp. FACHB-541]
MNQELRNLQAAAGAVFVEVAGTSVPSSFGNEAAALQAAQTGVAVCDRSHWGRILVSGDDRIRFLHNQTTNDFNRLQPGQGCDTVFVTSTGRTVDLVTAYALEDAVLLLTSPNRRKYLIEWMDRFIFFADKVDLKDITDTTAAFSLLGNESDALLQKLGLDEAIAQPHATHHLVNLAGIETRIATGSGLATPGYTLIVNAEQSAALWQQLTEAGAVPLGEQTWERLRIEQGRPMPNSELTEDYNPLEAGLWRTISFSKGCYIGQETIARLDTYKGVKQQLWGVRLSQSATPGEPLLLGEEKVGKLTSLIETEQGLLGLAYVRTKAGGAGLMVNVGAGTGEVVDLPFLTRDRTI